ncbi:FHA domain-containing protein [Myxococcota bacterium]
MAEAAILRLPHGSILVDEPRSTGEGLLRVEQCVLGGECRNGQLYVERPASCDLVLFYKGAVHSAVRVEGDLVRPLTLVEFFNEIRVAPAGRMRLCAAEAGIVLLAAVVFQNTPATKARANVADPEQVLTDIKSRNATAAILVARGAERNFVYCRAGEPVAVFFADRAQVPQESSVREQILAYGYASPTETTVEVYLDLQTQRDQHAGRRFEDLLAGCVGPPPFLLTVMHGQQRVQRRLIQTGKASIGRDPVNDIVIDHLSVSRQHCAIAWEKPNDNGVFVLRDSDSVNGTLVNGVRVNEIKLVPGDHLAIGDFEIQFGLAIEDSSERELQTVFMESSSDSRCKAHLILDGTAVPVEGTVFTIGKGGGATLRLSGFFMKKIQATLVREGTGTYRLLQIEGGRPVKVGGQTVPTGGLILESGQQITVGKHKLVFVMTRP